MGFIEELRSILDNAVKSVEITHALTSGGLDSSIASALARKYNDFKGVVVSLEGKSPDIKYAKILADKIGIKLDLVDVSLEEAINYVEKTVKILATFDPMEIVNSTVILIAFEHIKSDNGICVLTGDGGDELFAGYSYMHKMDFKELEEYIAKLPSFWSFSSFKIGESLDLKVFSPYLVDYVVEYALKIPPELKIVKFRDKKIGKYILRIAFEDLIPKEIAWREKHPIEVGSGFNRLYKVLEDLSEGLEFEEVRFWHRSQPYLYDIFRRYHRIKRNGEKSCPFCGSKVLGKHCKTCGAMVDQI